MNYLFGTGHSAFDYSDKRIQLPYSIPDEIEHQSIFTGVKHFVNNVDYASFVVTINLFKYPDPHAYAKNLESYNKKTVLFAPHNGGVIKNKIGNEVGFFISNISPFFLENDEKIGGVAIFFTATEPIYIFTLKKYLVTEDNETIITEDGKYIALE
jgi:hypothetical protein